MNKIVVGAADAAMEGNCAATHWAITSQRNEEEIIEGVESIEWKEGLVPAGEGIRLLDLVKNAVKNTAKLVEGEITTHNDNKKLLK